MTTVRAITADIAGLDIAAAIDGKGTYWLVIGNDSPRRHRAPVELFKELIGEVPDRLVVDCAASAPPNDVVLRLVS